MLGNLQTRVSNKWRRTLTSRLGRRNCTLNGVVPYVSFTFDDFPRTALLEGGTILRRHGVRGTYFVSMRLLGQDSPSGVIASADDVNRLLADGHELGCHTFDHLDGRCSTPGEFQRSIAQNQAEVEKLAPGLRLSSFAYPLDGPDLPIKRAVGRLYPVCRGGGQTYNGAVTDLSLLKAYFLDRRNRNDFEAIREVIEDNARDRGWLIFATHDVSRSPSQYGCETGLFERVVALAVESGARVVTMRDAYREQRAPAGPT
jgi:peptidoglycan/xylan/chitin deacetylase (PgdA/CDA1 family)